MTPRCPYHGTKVRNEQMRANMFLLAEYETETGALVGIYDDMLDQVAKALNKRIKADLMNCIVITGRTGSGKSTLAITLAKKLDPDFDIESIYVYSSTDFLEKLKTLDTNTSPIWLIDEGSYILNSKNAMARHDKFLTIALDTLRSRHITAIITLPSLFNLNRSVRDHMIDYLMMCPDRALLPGYKKRGFFEVYRPVNQKWSDKIFWQLLGAGVYKPLDEDTDKVYQKLKRDAQNRLIAAFTEGLEDAATDNRAESD